MSGHRVRGKRSSVKYRRKLEVEALESRQMLHGVGAGSIVLDGDVLEIRGDKHKNVIDVSLNGSGRIIVQIDGDIDETNPSGYDPSQVVSIQVHGLGGSDRITIGDTLNRPANIMGDRGNDTITGGPGNDTIDGGAGNDSIGSGEGDDSVLGGGGNDILSGGEGADILNGGKGNDRLDGEEGDDLLQTGSGRDALTGGTGADVFGPRTARGTRADFAVGTDVDAATPMTPGSFMDPGLLGTRTDLLSGAPDVTDRHHQSGPVDYSAYSNPPTYGPHHSRLRSGNDHGAPVQPTGVYTTELDDADVVHNLEHGQVWLSYDPALASAEDVAKLRALVQTFGGTRQGIILSPRSADDVAIALVSWAHLQTLTNFDAAAIGNFIVTNRGHAPEGFITP